MKTARRRLWTLVAFCLALSVSGRAVERDAPVPGLPSGLNGALPTAPNAQTPTGPLNAQIPVLPGVDVPATPQTPENAKVETPQAALPGANPGTGEILNQLSPENAPKIGDAQASSLAAAIFDPTIKTSASVGETPVAGQPSTQGEKLAPWEQEHAALAAVPETRQPRPEPTPTLKERLHYSSLYFRNIWFYIYTNIRNKWGPYIGYWRKMKESGIPPAVSQPREFFAHMRVFGQTGYFYVPGFGPVEDAEVLQEARETFAKFFNGPLVTEKERAAFDGFVDRAMLFNNKRRAASKFRANVRDNMLKASTMMPEKIAPFFDGLPVVAKTEDFQNNTAEMILAQFKQTVLEVINEEPKDAKDRVTGVILIGSFALGAATPKSDFDIEPLTADGGDGRVRAFADKVQKRWEALGRQATNPVSFHYFGYLNSRWELRAIHHEPYIIISPDQAIVDNLAMRPGEPPSHVPSRKRSAMGTFLRGVQYAAVYATSLITPAKYPEKL
jgi:hypothetical protein